MMDGLQRLPHLLLEGGAGQVQRHIEALAAAGKVFADFAFGLAGVVVFAGHDATAQQPLQVGELAFVTLADGKFQQAHALFAGADKHRPQRAVKTV